MMKITDLSHLFKRENLHNWWLTKYFFAPLYVCEVYKTDAIKMEVLHFDLQISSAMEENGVVQGF